MQNTKGWVLKFAAQSSFFPHNFDCEQAHRDGGLSPQPLAKNPLQSFLPKISHPFLLEHTLTPSDIALGFAGRVVMPVQCLCCWMCGSVLYSGNSLNLKSRAHLISGMFASILICALFLAKTAVVDEQTCCIIFCMRTPTMRAPTHSSATTTII